MVTKAKRRATVAAAGSLTDVLLGKAEAMAVSLGTSELREAQRDGDIHH